MRPSGRSVDQMRAIHFTPDFTQHAEGSVLVEFGETRVLATASVESKVPHFLKGKSEGWITAEYGMLPRSTHTRNAREAARGKQGGRTPHEFQSNVFKTQAALLIRKGEFFRQVVYSW